MPNKTIYVSDDDMPLFQRATELAGGKLSTAISAALRKWVEIEEGREAGYSEVTVMVGTGTRRKQRFIGVLLGEWGRTVSGRVEQFKVYGTRSGKFVLHTERSDDWRTQSDSGPGGWIGDLKGMLGLGDSSWGFIKGEATLEVLDTVDELRERVPADFYDMVVQATKQDPIEDLDV